MTELETSFGNIGRLRLQTLSFTRLVDQQRDSLECECELDDAPLGVIVTVSGAPIIELGSWPDALNSSPESPWVLQPDGKIRREQSLQLQPA
jgi:hypothetical protein